MTTERTAALVHASTVALKGSGVLLLGQSRAGKSDLALRLINAGALLTADDQTRLFQENGRLMADTPKNIEGLLEMRGAGIVRLPHSGPVPVVLAIELQATGIPRLPEPRNFALPAPLTVQGPPLIVLNPFEVSAPAKIATLVDALNAGSVVAGPLAGL